MTDENHTRMSILVRATAGDQLAWEKIVEIYGPMIESRCRRWGFSTADADDLTQDIFISLHKSLPSFRKSEKTHGFRQWMWTIAGRRRIDFLRRNGKLETATGGSTAQGVIQQLPEDISEEVDWNPDEWETEALTRAMDILLTNFQESRRLAFLKTVVEGRENSDVAEELGLSLAAVRQSKHAVLKSLREQLGDILPLGDSEGDRN